MPARRQRPASARSGGRRSSAYYGVSGAFVPSAISGLQLWLDATKIVSTDGTALGTWSDLSGNGRDATQGTGTSQPKYKVSQFGSSPGVQFGTTDKFNSVGSSGSTAFTAFTLYAVIKRATAIVNTAAYDLRGATGGANNVIISLITDASGQWGARIRNNAATLQTISTTDTTTTAQVYEHWWDGTTQRFYKSGTQIGTDGAFTGTVTIDWGGSSACFVGSSNGSDWGTDANPGTIGEFLLYDTALSVSNRTAVKNYLGAKYGITVA